MAFLYVPNGIVMEDWTPAGGLGSTPLGDLPRISRALAPYRDDLMILSGLTSDAGRAHRRWPGRSRPRGRGLPDRRASEEDVRQGHPGRRLDGSDRRRSASEGADPVRVARARLRRRHSGRQLRQRLQLRVQQQPLVAHAEHAESARGPAARGLRADVRRGRRREGSGAAASAAWSYRQEHSRLRRSAMRRA